MISVIIFYVLLAIYLASAVAFVLKFGLTRTGILGSVAFAILILRSITVIVSAKLIAIGGGWLKWQYLNIWHELCILSAFAFLLAAILFAPPNQVSAVGLIKAWLISFLRVGYGLIPVGDGKWLKHPIPPAKGKLLFSQSFLFPIGRLYAIPLALQDEFFRRLHKAKVSSRYLKILLAIGGCLPLLEDATHVKFMSFLPPMLLILSFLFGVMFPVFVFRLRLRRFVRSEMTRVRPVRPVAWQFRLFNLSILVFAFVYGFLTAYVDAFIGAAIDKVKGLSSKSIEYLTESTVMEFFTCSQNPFWVILVAFLKAVVGMVLLLISTFVFLLFGSAIIRVQLDLSPLMALLAVAGFAFGFVYYIDSECSHRGTGSKV